LNASGGSDEDGLGFFFSFGVSLFCVYLSS
jgi:hypothetical protein